MLKLLDSELSLSIATEFRILSISYKLNPLI